MDNLTHSLVGAALGQLGLKRKTGLGMATLVIAANIPDIDATCTIYGIESLAMRRGHTHGPVAMLALPALLTGIMVAFDRWQTRRGTRPAGRLPVRPGAVFALALIGALSHPALDWLNNYGIRLLEPFSGRWFYGDTLFIIDVWIWAMLGLGVWYSRRWEKRGDARWRQPAAIALALMTGYIGLNGWISQRATKVAGQLLGAQSLPRPALIVPRAVPLTFWRREVLWRDAQVYGRTYYSMFGPRVASAATNEPPAPTGMNDPKVTEALRANAEARAFLFWSRMPIVERRDGAIILRDQRFSDPALGTRFMLRIPDTK